MISRIIKVELGKGYQPKPKAEADNPYRDLIILDITKTESNNCFIIHLTNVKIWKSCFCSFTDGKQHESRVDMLTLAVIHDTITRDLDMIIV